VGKSFGSGMFIWPHGLHVDRDGNVWVTDSVTAQGVAMAAKAGGRAGHQVVKFSPDGKALMTLAEEGGPGSEHEPSQGRRGGRRALPLTVPERSRGGCQWRHLRRGWPRRQREQPCGEVLEGRKVHQ